MLVYHNGLLKCTQKYYRIQMFGLFLVIVKMFV